MRLHAAHHQHVIGPEGVLIKMNRKTLRRLAHDHRFHARPDRAAAIGLGDSVTFDQPALPLGRAAAVAAHRRHNERLRPQRLKMLHRRLDDQGDIGDAPAAGRNRHALPRLDLLGQIEPGQLAGHRRRNLLDRQHWRLKRLADAKNERGTATWLATAPQKGGEVP